MNRVFITGDKHRNFSDLYGFCEKLPTDTGDWMIVLGDNGVNWYGDGRDEIYKEYLSRIPVRFMMIRGNHDMRPENAVFTLESGNTVPKYEPCFVETETVSGRFLTQRDFPNLFFAQDGETYQIDKNTSAFVIGGAYSIDKLYRLMHGITWFPDEQLDAKERVHVGKRFQTFASLKDNNQAARLFVFSHTCPIRFMPYEAKFAGVPHKSEDYTMEQWMDQLYESARNQLDGWYCGHWHINKVDGPMTFLYEDVREITINNKRGIL